MLTKIKMKNIFFSCIYNGIKPVILNNKLNEIPEQMIDSKKFVKIYKPKFQLTKFDDGISKTISWYKDFYQNKS